MSDSEDTDGSLTSFSDTASEPEVGYLSRKSRKSSSPRTSPHHFLGVHQRLWMLIVLLSSASAVLILCMVGDSKQIDVEYVCREPGVQIIMDSDGAGGSGERMR